MPNRKTLYCDIEFINALGERAKIDFINLCDESCIVVNVPLPKFKMEAYKDMTIKMMEKKRNDGLCTITYKDFTCDSMQLDEDMSARLSPIILIKQTQKQRREQNLCCQYKKLYGIACYDQTSFNEIELLTNDDGFAIMKGESDSWRIRFENVKLKGNAMVIIDPYLIADTRTYNKNIYEILDSLLPDETATEYNLTIITQEANEGWEERYNKLVSYIKKVRPKLSFRFNLLNDTTKVFHDRIILTNYYTLTCGAGFDLFNERGVARHTTQVSFLYPYIQRHVKWAADNYTNYIKTAARKMSSNEFYGENRDNRLFLINLEEK